MPRVGYKVKSIRRFKQEPSVLVSGVCHFELLKQNIAVIISGWKMMKDLSFFLSPLLPLLNCPYFSIVSIINVLIRE